MLNFHSSTKEIKAELEEQLKSNLPVCYTVDFNEATAKGMIPVGFAQILNDVPSRGSSSINTIFAGANALADAFGTNSFEASNNIYRSRTLVNEATAKILQTKIGQPLNGFSLYVVDTIEPQYEGQSEAITKDGTIKLSNGKPYYTSVIFAQTGTMEHSVVTRDKVESTVEEIQREAANAVSK